MVLSSSLLRIGLIERGAKVFANKSATNAADLLSEWFG